MTPTAVETYNGLIPKMRQDGHTLQQIGDACGVTRERIRQILQQHYPNTVSPLLKELDASKLLGWPNGRLAQMRKKGIVSPIHRGMFWFYDRDELEKAMLAGYRPCAMCGEVIGTIRNRKYCIKCAAKRHRNYYPFMTPERRKIAKATSNRWAREHPERHRELSRKHVATYQAKKRKQHFKETTYVVVKGSILPIGTEFKAIGCEKWHLILASGETIPVNYIRKK